MPSPTEDLRTELARRAETIDVIAAERDAALASVRALVVIIAKQGGHMKPEHQIAYRDAQALLDIGPLTRVKPWTDRPTCLLCKHAHPIGPCNPRFWERT